MIVVQDRDVQLNTTVEYQSHDNTTVQLRDKNFCVNFHTSLLQAVLNSIQMLFLRGLPNNYKFST